MRDSPDDAMLPHHGDQESSLPSHGARSFLAAAEQKGTTCIPHVAPDLPVTVPVITSTAGRLGSVLLCPARRAHFTSWCLDGLRVCCAEPSAPPLPQQLDSTIQDVPPALHSSHERAHSNHIVESQLAYISEGPFEEGLKERLWQV